MALAGEIKALIQLDGVDKVKQSLSDLGASVEKAAADLGKAGSILDTVGKKMQDMGGKISATGKGLSKSVTAPIVGLGLTVGKLSVDFEQSFAKVNTLLRDDTDIDAYKKSIKNMSKEMGVSLDDYSEATYSAISAGVEQGEAVEFTAKAVKLAKGGFTDTATAVDIMTTAINAYGLESKDAGKISDYLITTQNAGKTTVDELAASMGAVIPIAEANGVGMDQLSTAYAVLTKNGIATSEAGTGIKAMFSELGKSGTTADKVLQEMGGKSFKQLISEGANVSDVIQDMTAFAEKNGLSLGDMFGSVEAGTAAMTLAKGEGKEFDDILDQMGKSSGSTEKAFNTMEQTAGAKMAKAFNSMKISLTDVGDALAPMIVTLADLLGKMAEKLAVLAGWFVGLSDKQKKWIVTLLGIAAAIGPLLVLFGSTITALGSIASAAGKFGGVLSKLPKAFKLVVGGLKSMYAFMLANPLIAIGIAVIALIVIIVKNWDTIKEVTAKLGEWLGTFFSGIWSKLKTSASGDLTEMVTFITGIWDKLKEASSEKFTQLKDFIASIWTGISTGAATAWGAITAFLSGVWSSIVELTATIWKPIETFFISFWNGIKAVFSFAWDAIKLVITVALGLIMVVIATVWNGIATVINTVLSVIKTIVSTGFNAMQQVINTVMNFIKATIGPIWESIRAVISNVVNAIKTKVTTVWTAIKDATMAIFTVIKTYAVSIWTSLVSAVTSVVTSLKNSITNIFNSIKTVATSVWNSIKTAISSVVTAIRTTVTSIFNSLKSSISAIFNSIRSVASSVWNGIKSTISNVVSGIRNSVSNSFTSLRSTVSNIWSGIKSAIMTPINAAKDGVRNAIEAMKGFFNFSWKLPSIKMPHFSVSGSANPMDWIKQGVPKIGVNWYKTGGIATGASVVGVGEAGDEAIVPLSNKSRMKPFAQAVSSMIDKKESPEESGSGGPVTLTVPVMLDGKEIARAVVEDLDTALYSKRRKTAKAKGRL